jgi:TP901 family phage tail tape measure protein
MNSLGLGVVVSMRDAFSRNAQRIQSSMTALDQTVAAASASMQRNLDRIQKGTMMIGAGLSMLAIPAALVASTAATQKALGELASVGVKDLGALELAAQRFTNEWSGSSKSEFLTAAYDVKSALSSLSDEAVGTFASMAALTGKATKATTAEMVGTFTTAYGIFKPIMADLSDMEWAQQFSGAMAQTVASFKTTGAQMADAIKGIGAVAASSNIPLEEQLAILGQLQTTMPGAEAGTLYKSFIMKAAEAGEALGLEFIDSTGRLKGVLEILDAVKEKFPDLSQAAAQVEIKKAFGSDEAVKFLLQMSQGMESLRGNIDSVGRAMRTGTAVTLEMARVMNADIGSRFGLLKQQLQNLFEILGATLLPIVIPLMERLSGFILRLQSIAQNAPNVTRAVLTMMLVLGSLTVIVGGITAAVGTIGIMIPAIKAGFLALSAGAGSAVAAIGAWLLPVLAAIALVVGGVYLLKRAWDSNFAGIQDIVYGAWNRVKMVFEGIRQLITSLSGGTGQLSADVAQQLQEMGLLGFVTTVFRVYYRVREFLSALWQAFSGSFGAIREILEPAVNSLFQAYRELAGALGFVFQSLTAGDNMGAIDFWQALGTAVGETLGFLAKVAAVVVRFVIQPTILLVSVLAQVIRVGYTVGSALVGAFVLGSKFVHRFFLPLRLLVQFLRHAFVAVGTLWSVFRGEMSIVDGLKAIGRSALQFLATPFLWARDVVVGAFRGLASVPGLLLGMLRLAGRGALAVISNLPLVRLLRWVVGKALSVFEGNGFAEAGKGLVQGIGRGILAMAGWPVRMVSGLLGRLIGVFGGGASGADEAGRGIIASMVLGMLRLISWPGRVLLGGLSSLWSAVSSFISRFGEIGNRMLMVLTAPLRLFAGLAQGFVGLAMAPFAWLASFLSGLWSQMTGGPLGFVQTLWGLFGGLLGPLLSPFAALGSLVSGIWQSLSAGAGLFVEAISGRFTGLFGKLESAAGLAKKALGWLFGGTDAAVVEAPAVATPAQAAAAIPAALASSIEIPGTPILPPALPAAPEAVAAPVVGPMPAETFDSGAAAVSLPVPPVPPPQTPTMVPALAVMPNWAEVESGLTRLLARLNILLETGINRIQAMGGAAVRQVAAPAAVAISLTSPAIPAPVLSVPAPQLSIPERPAPIVAPVSLATPALAAIPVVNRPLPAAPVVVPSRERDRPQVPNSALWGGARQPREQAGPDLRPLLRSIRLEGEAGRIQRRVESVGDRAGRVMRNPDRELRQTGISIANRETQRIRPVRVEPIRGMGLRFDPGEALRLASREILRPKPPEPPSQEETPAPQLPIPPEQEQGEDAVTAPATPSPSIQPTLRPDQAALLGETRGSLAGTPSSSGAKPAESPADIARLLEAILSEVRSAGDRPINLTVTTKLDGREIAQAVYKDLRERKIRNYDTL